MLQVYPLYMQRSVIMLSAQLSHLIKTAVVPSSSLTLDRPLHPQTLNNGYISINGTPTDCVHLGLNGLLPDSMDMVVAGINLGANLGDDVLYSGTVAAALEGRFLQRPSFAFSLLSRQPDNLPSAAWFARRLIEAHDALPLGCAYSV